MARTPALSLAVALLAAAPAPAEPGVPHANTRRTGYADIELTPPYRLAWAHAADHAPRPAWREPAWEPQRIDFDYAFAVSSDGRRVYYASSADHALHALDADTGRELWRYTTDAPVRLAPEFHGGNVLFGSDDGFVYCLTADAGEPVWRFRPAVPDSRLIGNEQMISRRPVRSGVLVEGDRAYAAFGMLASEGVAVCCLDARTGKPIWTNDTCGIRYMARPHQVTMGGVSPQGYMAVSGRRLIVACGRSTPALFDKATGECLYHEADGDFTGGARLMAARGLVFTQADTLAKEFGSQLRRKSKGPEADIFELATLVALDERTGREVFSLRGGSRGVLADDGLITLIGRGRLIAVDIAKVRGAIGKKTVIRHTMGHFVEPGRIRRWSAKVDRVYALLQAGGTILAGGRGTVQAFAADDGERLWQAKVRGQVRAMCLAGRRLIASTTAGLVYCFAPAGGAGAEPAATPEPPSPPPATEGRGYCLVLGPTSADTLARHAATYDLVLHATSADPEDLRRGLRAKRLYGPRVVVHRLGGPKLPYTDYFANAVFAAAPPSGPNAAGALAEMVRVLRPCGGEVHIACPAGGRDELRRALLGADVPAGEIRVADGAMIVRRGRLAGAGEWTHQYGGPGKSVSSDERRVRLPLKAVWFGGPGPADAVSRHFRGPAPLVVQGRCFIPGTDHLTAMDVYNGRVLWRREIRDLAHWPAAYRGPSLAVDRQFVYALDRLRCLRIDPATGSTHDELAPPPEAMPAGGAKGLEWEYLAATDGRIVGTLGWANVKHEWWSKAYPVNRVLFALAKPAGRAAWVHKPAAGIDSDAIAIDGGRVFVIEGVPRYGYVKRRRGAKADAPGPRTLRALDLATGEPLWETDDVTPTVNSLWAADGVVVATPVPFGRTMLDRGAAKAGGGIAAYAAEDGRTLWRVEKTKIVAPFITGGVLYTPKAYDLKTGRPIPPMAGGRKQYSAGLALLCGTLSGCPTLSMSRQSSLGFRDLAGQSGVYQYPIIRSSCWINMIPAGGLVIVPEGGSSCQCAYNYKTSLALMSDERHFHFGIGGSGRPGPAGVRLNLAAPGDRPDGDGLIWHAWPRPTAYGRCLGSQPYGPKVARAGLGVEAPEDAPPLRTVGRNPDWAGIEGTEMPWLHSFALAGPVRLTVRVPPTVQQAAAAVVRLYFCELAEPERPRVFDVTLDGRRVIEGLNVAAEAGGSRKALVRELPLNRAKAVSLELVSRDPEGPPPMLSGVAIVAAE